MIYTFWDRRIKKAQIKQVMYIHLNFKKNIKKKYNLENIGMDERILK